MAQRHILVVDDEPMVLDIISRDLIAAGFRVTTAASGAAALKAARADRPDVAVIDLLMPGLDGYALCSMFKRDLSLRVPVVIITARSDQADEQRARDLGADLFLRKPFSSKALRDGITGLLEATPQS